MQLFTRVSLPLHVISTVQSLAVATSFNLGLRSSAWSALAPKHTIISCRFSMVEWPMHLYTYYATINKTWPMLVRLVYNDSRSLYKRCQVFVQKMSGFAP